MPIASQRHVRDDRGVVLSSFSTFSSASSAGVFRFAVAMPSVCQRQHARDDCRSWYFPRTACFLLRQRGVRKHNNQETWRRPHSTVKCGVFMGRDVVCLCINLEHTIGGVVFTVGVLAVRIPRGPTCHRRTFFRCNSRRDTFLLMFDFGLM